MRQSFGILRQGEYLKYAGWGYIECVQKNGTAWIMLQNAKKPYDRRVSTGEYIGVERDRK